MHSPSNGFLDHASAALKDSAGIKRRYAQAQATQALRNTAVADFDGFDALRQHVKRIKRHTLDNLDYYLGRFEKEAVHNGNRVHFARDAEEMNNIALDICQQHNARKVIKGKSMVTEETALNKVLQQAGVEVMETDLGEYIVQLAGECPSHIVTPALHKSAKDVRGLFYHNHKLQDRELHDAEDLVNEARTVLRKHFLKADVGIIGSNALIAENGYSMLVTNEGNADLCANLPPVLIICTTIDRVLPRAQDATAMLRLLTRSATGQSQTSYTSFYSGPRRAADIDGPVETHFVLLDNQRSDILTSQFTEILECIRCGACLNHCPIYNSVGGHAYDSVYQGPMGSVLTPLLTSLEASHALPNACSSCGRCAEVCPAEIPLPDMLRDLRQMENTEKLSAPRWRYGIKLHAWLARHPPLYHAFTAILISLLHLLGRKQGGFAQLPLAGGWTSQRDFPSPQRQTFMQLYKEKSKGET